MQVGNKLGHGECVSGSLLGWGNHPSSPPARVWSEHTGYQVHTHVPCRQQAHTCTHVPGSVPWSFIGVYAHILT